MSGLHVARRFCFRIVSLLSAIVFLLSMVGSVPAARAASGSLEEICYGVVVYGQGGCRGYFHNDILYGSSTGIKGENVLINRSGGQAISEKTIGTNANPQSFIQWANYLLNSDGNSNYTYNKAGVAFLIDAMLGVRGGSLGSSSAGIAYAQAKFGDWQSRVNDYIDRVGGRSIEWKNPTILKPGTINSMHACTAASTNAQCSADGIQAGDYDSHDFAFYRMPASGGTEVSTEIIFHNPDGTTFRIRRECANIVGVPSPLAEHVEVNNDYNLHPGVDVSINGGDTAGNVVQVGDTVRFTYTVYNSGHTSDGSTRCTVYGNTFPGYHDQPGNAETGSVDAGATAATGCPRVFPITSHTQLGPDETVPITAGNQTICRSVFVDPNVPHGGPLGAEACVYVANQPYFKVYGGDVSVGNGQASGATSTACTNNDDAAILGWNKGTAGYPGAGTQYGAYALDIINHFATGLNSSGVAPPTGLAFSNSSTTTARVASGNYGGQYESVPCMPDYYAIGTAGATNALPTHTIGGIGASGAYTENAPSTITPITLSGGSVAPGKRVQVFVKGNVYITSNVTYGPGDWSVANSPLFELVVKGNIYIDSGVSELDGAYIAQQTATGYGGSIITCATPSTAAVNAMLPLDGDLYNTCNRKLTVVGALSAANDISLLRTSDTLSSAGGSGETTGNSHAAEMFQYGPGLWLAQPAPGTPVNNNAYDSITSLPPIL